MSLYAAILHLRFSSCCFLRTWRAHSRDLAQQIDEDRCIIHLPGGFFHVLSQESKRKKIGQVRQKISKTAEMS